MKNKKIGLLLIVIIAIAIGGSIFVSYAAKKEGKQELTLEIDKEKDKKNKLKELTDQEILDMYTKSLQEIFNLYDNDKGVKNANYNPEDAYYVLADINDEYATKEKREQILDKIFTENISANHKKYKEVDGALKVEYCSFILEFYLQADTVKLLSKEFLNETEMKVQILKITSEPEILDEKTAEIRTFNLKLENDNIKFSTELIAGMPFDLVDVVNRIDLEREKMSEENILALVKEVEEIYKLSQNKKNDDPTYTINFLKENTNKTYDKTYDNKKIEEGYEIYKSKEWVDESDDTIIIQNVVNIKDIDDSTADVNISLRYRKGLLFYEGKAIKSKENELICLTDMGFGLTYMIIERSTDKVEIKYFITDENLEHNREYSLNDPEILAAFDYESIKNHSVDQNLILYKHNPQASEKATIKYDSIIEIVKLLYQEEFPNANN